MSRQVMMITDPNSTTAAYGIASPQSAKIDWAPRHPSSEYIYPSLLALLSNLHTYLATEFLAHKEGVLKETTFIAQRKVGGFAKGLRAFWVVQFLIYSIRTQLPFIGVAELFGFGFIIFSLDAWALPRLQRKIWLFFFFCIG